MCELYRHFDKHGTLLYVGISLSSVDRLNTHMSEARWSDWIVKVEIERFKDRNQAIIAERNAIKFEKPLFNKVHNVLNYLGQCKGRWNIIEVETGLEDGWYFYYPYDVADAHDEWRPAYTHRIVRCESERRENRQDLTDACRATIIEKYNVPRSHAQPESSTTQQPGS